MHLFQLCISSSSKLLSFHVVACDIQGDMDLLNLLELDAESYQQIMDTFIDDTAYLLLLTDGENMSFVQVCNQQQFNSYQYK